MCSKFLLPQNKLKSWLLKMLCFLSREKNKRTPDEAPAAPATFAAAAKKG